MHPSLSPVARFLTLAVFCFVVARPGWAQAPAVPDTLGFPVLGVLPIEDPVHTFLDRQQTLGRLPGFHLAAKPLSGAEAQRALDSLHIRKATLSPLDQRLLERFRGERPGPNARLAQRLWGPLFANGRDLLSVQHPDYALTFSPLAYLSAGAVRRTAQPNQPAQAPVWQNTRGFRVAGHIGRLYFESRLLENQQRPPLFSYNDSLTTAPRLGYAANPSGEIYDYFLATGLVGYRTRYIDVRLGRDQNRWSFGSNSLHLSNYATGYDQLHLRTSIGWFSYDNLFTRFIDRVPTRPVFGLLPQKYGAFHRLGVAFPHGWELALFESVLFATDTTAERQRRGFDIAYLNPVIFYRAVEREFGSSDNVLLGAEVAWNATPGVRVYGQALLDELRVSELLKDWWGNKWGLLGGVMFAEWPTPGVWLQLEGAVQRPFLYSHRRIETAFVNQDDPLGHAAGPNSVDLAMRMQVSVSERLTLGSNARWTLRGRSNALENVGDDPRISYETRFANRGVSLLVGNRQRVWDVEGWVSYEWLPHLWLDAQISASSDLQGGAQPIRYLAPVLALRWGLPVPSSRY